MATSSVGFENFFSTTLNGAVSDSDLTINLNAVPTPSEGFLVIEPDTAGKREVIYYTSKGASSVTVPSGAGNGRGYDGTTATSHADGSTVIMAPVAAMFEALQDMTAMADGIIATADIADGAVTNAKLNTTAGELGGVWQDWSPTWLNITVGNGTEVAKYTQVGKTVHLFYSLTFGSTTSVDSTNPRITLPVNASSNFTGAPSPPTGNLVKFYEDGVGVYFGTANFYDADEIIIREINVSGSLLTESAVGATSPFTWGTSDGLMFTLTYESV